MKLKIIKIIWDKEKWWWRYTVERDRPNDVVTVNFSEIEHHHLVAAHPTFVSREAFGMARHHFKQLDRANAPRSELVREATRPLFARHEPEPVTQGEFL